MSSAQSKPSVFRAFNKTFWLNFNGSNVLTIIAVINFIVMILITDAVGIDLDEIDLDSYSHLLGLKLFYFVAAAFAFFGMWTKRVWLVIGFILAQLHFLVLIVFPFCFKNFGKSSEMAEAAMKTFDNDLKMKHWWVLYVVSIFATKVQLLLTWLPVITQSIIVVITAGNVVYFYWKKRQAKMARRLVADAETGFIMEEDMMHELIGDDALLTIGQWESGNVTPACQYNIQTTFNNSEFIKPYV